MNDPKLPLPRHRQHHLYWLLQLVILVGCSHRLSHAYSTRSSTSAPHHRPLDAIDRSPPHDIPTNCNAHNNKTGSRRAFFQRGTTALTTAAAGAALTISTSIPQPANAAKAPIPLPGTPAPDFSLLSTRGKITNLDSLTAEKKWTVLYFYPGAFTSGCTLEARKFQEELPKFQEMNSQVVGVSVDSIEKNSEFCSSEKLDFYMLTDAGGKVSKAYGSSLSIPGFGTFSNRQTYIIDPEKNVRWAFVDVESRILQHPGDVLEKLKELQQA